MGECDAAFTPPDSGRCRDSAAGGHRWRWGSQAPGQMCELPGAPGLEEARGAQGPGLNGPFLSLQQAHPLFVGLFVCSLPQAVSVLLFLPQGSAWGRHPQEHQASSMFRALLISPRAGGPKGRVAFPLCHRLGKTQRAHLRGTESQDPLTRAGAPRRGLARILAPAPPQGTMSRL